MAKKTTTTTEPNLVQLATRIPGALHKTMKLHCVQHETSVMDFVTAAITARLGTAKKKKK